MKIKYLFALIPLLICCGMVACSDNSLNETSSLTSFETSTSEIKEDFTFVLEDNGLTLDKVDYVFAKASEADDYPPEAIVSINVDSSWRYCTMIQDNETKIVIENEDVISNEAISLKTITMNDIGGSSNEIAGFELVIDRKLINVGESRIKIKLKPGNGSSSINVLTTLCFNICVKDFGQIDVDTYNVTLIVDTSGLTSIINKESNNATYVHLIVCDDASYSDCYGTKADYNLEFNILEEKYDTTMRFGVFHFAIGHTYRTILYVGGMSAYDVIWINLTSTEKTTSYSFVNFENDSFSHLLVNENHAVVKAKLGNYTAY